MRGGAGECGSGDGEERERDGGEAEVSHGLSYFGSGRHVGVPQMGEAGDELPRLV